MHRTLELVSNTSPGTTGAALGIGAFQHPANIGVGHVASNIFDRLSVGIVLLNRSAEIVFANAAARSMSENGGSLRLNGSVRSHSSLHDRRLGALVRSAISGTSACAISIPSDSGRSVMVMAAPTEGPDHGSVRDLRSAAAVLVICDPNRAAQVPTAWMMDAYGLTSAEVRVALALASGTSIANTARRLKISANTVKTHLRRVYDKTGTNRQAELSRLIATIGLVLGSEIELNDR
jgi:DNA-binding CsgD family transcriptional regulator